MSNSDPAGDGTSSIIGRIPTWVIVVTILLLLSLYAVLMSWSWMSADNQNMSDIVWNRRLVPFEGLEAIVAAVIGGIFGATPSLLRARKAEDRAQKEEQEAKEARERLAVAINKGQTLAVAIRNRERTTGGEGAYLLERGLIEHFARAPTNQYDQESITVALQGKEYVSTLAGLRELADSLFPPSP